MIAMVCTFHNGYALRYFMTLSPVIAGPTLARARCTTILDPETYRRELGRFCNWFAVDISGAGVGKGKVDSPEGIGKE